MKLLVTGGAGFIGSCFIRHVLSKHSDYEIINLDKLTYAGNIENLDDIKNDRRYSFVKGDICDKNLVIIQLYLTLICGKLVVYLREIEDSLKVERKIHIQMYPEKRLVKIKKYLSVKVLIILRLALFRSLYPKRLHLIDG